MFRQTVFLALLFAAHVAAHPISVTQADAVVSDQKLALAVELFLEDLFLFHGLAPDKDGNLAPEDIRTAMEKHKAFLLERIEVRDAEGVPLSGSVQSIEECEIPDDGIPLTDLMAHSLIYHIEYPLKDSPEFLTFKQMLGNTSFGFPAQMLLRLKQQDAAAPYMADLRSNEPVTIRLDAENPPPPPDAPREEWEQWQQQREESTLGISSYSSVYSFLYIEDNEVRHEILVPILTVEASLPIERADPDFLDIAEQEKARPAIAELFSKANPIRIDGTLVEPTVDRIDFYSLNFKDFAQRADQRRVSMANARIGVILTYPTQGTPSSVEVTWDLFNKFLWGSQTTVFAFDQTEQVFFSPYQKTFQWKNPGRPARPPIQQVPVALPPPPRWNVPAVSLSLLLVGVLGAAWFHRSFLALTIFLLGGTIAAALTIQTGRVEIPIPWAPVESLSDAKAKSVLESLQKNIYRAFDYKSENDIYDALARSIAGPLLEKTYLDIRRGLVMQEQGGAVARVTDVQLVQADRKPLHEKAKDERGFTYEAVWDVTGTVEHWGHIHERKNRYEATFTVEPRDEAWKVIALDVNREDRLEFNTRLRTAANPPEPDPASTSESDKTTPTDSTPAKP